MLSHRERNFQRHVVSLEALVPEDNFYREVEAKLDLSFVRDLVKHLYGPFGRPSIDPVVFFKLHLIMFFEGIRSERQLMDMVNMRLDHRWFIGYDLTEPVPDHSSLSKIRTRYGLEVFQRFFERIVELCIDAGLVWGKELYFDGTKVQADAAIDSLVPRWYARARQHVEALFEETTNPEFVSNPRGLVEKYDGTRLTERRQPSYERTVDSKVSLTDPDASPMSRFTGDRTTLGYHTHYVVDGGKARIILAALVTPASIMDNTPMLDLERWVRFRWRLFPHIAVGDTKYGTVANIVGLEQDGIRAYLPTADLTQRRPYYPLPAFRYVADRDVYLCPQGQELSFHTHNYGMEYFVYRAPPGVCDACPVRAQCTNSRSGRSLHRSFFQTYLDHAARYRHTQAYKIAMRKRQVWVEPLFGEGKQWHGMRRFRLRRLWRVNIEGLIRAAGQNIKRLLKGKTWSRPLRPAGSAALRPYLLGLGIDYADPLLRLRRLFQQALLLS